MIFSGIVTYILNDNNIFFFGGGGGRQRIFFCGGGGGSFYPSNTLDRTMVFTWVKLVILILTRLNTHSDELKKLVN